MKVTAENLNSLLSDHGNMMLVRIMDDGAPHVGRLRRTEVVSWGATFAFPEGDVERMRDTLALMRRDTVALVHVLPNNPPANRYLVKYGEVW